MLVPFFWNNYTFISHLCVFFTSICHISNSNDNYFSLKKSKLKWFVFLVIFHPRVSISSMFLRVKYVEMDGNEWWKPPLNPKNKHEKSSSNFWAEGTRSKASKKWSTLHTPRCGTTTPEVGKDSAARVKRDLGSNGMCEEFTAVDV